jgi:hypothetical protein
MQQLRHVFIAFQSQRRFRVAADDIIATINETEAYIFNSVVCQIDILKFWRLLGRLCHGKYSSRQRGARSQLMHSDQSTHPFQDRSDGRYSGVEALC